jgi:alcohol-forming fatty acyl-CoA reductase
LQATPVWPPCLLLQWNAGPMLTRHTEVIFLTGVTGYLGKVVLYELLRRRSELEWGKIIVLIRRDAKPTLNTKAPVSGDSERKQACRFLDQVATSTCFKKIPAGWTKLVEVVYGDLEEPLLGLDNTRYENLSRQITYVIHNAACVQFNQPLAEAVKVNVHGTLTVLDLAKSCSRLKRFVYTSTAYVNPHNGVDRKYERLASMRLPHSPQDLLDAISSGSVSEQEIMRQTGHPNTYTLAKCLAEHMVLQNCGTVPVTIVRPSIISAALEHPQPGWTDNFTALAGFVLAAHNGGLLALEGSLDAELDLVPVDYVATCLIQATFEPLDSPRPQASIKYATSGLRGLGPRNLSPLGAAYFQCEPVRWYRPKASVLDRAGQYMRQKLPLRLTQGLCWATGDNKACEQLGRGIQALDNLGKHFSYFTSNTFEFLPSCTAGNRTAPCFQPRQYMQIVFRGTQQYMLRRARERGQLSRERVIAGRDFREGGKNLVKLLLTTRGNRLYRFTAFVVQTVLGRIFERVTFDQDAFYDTMEGWQPGLEDEKLLILPTYRSWVDYIICPYLFYFYPAMGIKIPRIGVQYNLESRPVLGWLLKSLGVFFVKSGAGQPHTALKEQVRAMVDADEQVMVFVEGQKDGSRAILPSTQQVLCALQATEHKFKVLPISISYKRLPQEALVRGSFMSVMGLIGWGVDLLRGRVNLGALHMTCGKLLSMNPQTDLHELIAQVSNEVRPDTVMQTSLLHGNIHNQHRAQADGGLRRHSQTVLLPSKEGEGVTCPRKELETHDITILDGCLSDDLPLHAVVAKSLTNRWLPRIHGYELLAKPTEVAAG